MKETFLSTSFLFFNDIPSITCWRVFVELKRIHTLFICHKVLVMVRLYFIKKFSLLYEKIITICNNRSLILLSLIFQINRLLKRKKEKIKVWLQIFEIYYNSISIRVRISFVSTNFATSNSEHRKYIIFLT